MEEHYVDGDKYELRKGEETPFNPEKLYAYLNDEMFMPVENVEEFHRVLKRAGLRGLVKEKE